MPTGKPCRAERCNRGRTARGFTYLLLLFGVAIGSAGLAAAGTAWSTAAQRAREAELLFRGGEYARALAAYRHATPSGQPAAPLNLAELLEDRRSPRTQRHLRRLYPDPYTGAADWVLLREGDRITGLHSRAETPVFRAPPGHAEADRDQSRSQSHSEAASAPPRTARAADWHFTADNAPQPGLPPYPPVTAAARSLPP